MCGGLLATVVLGRSITLILMVDLQVGVHLYQVLEVFLSLPTEGCQPLILLLKLLDFCLHLLILLDVLTGVLQGAIIVLLVLLQGFHFKFYRHIVEQLFFEKSVLSSDICRMISRDPEAKVDTRI